MSDEEKRNNSQMNHVHHHHHHHHHHRRNRHLGMKIFGGLVGVIAAIAVVLGLSAWNNLKTASANMYNAPKTTRYRDAQKTLKAGKPINILVLGADTGAFSRNKKNETDSIMMVTLNPKNRRTTIISVPRKMKVKLASNQKTTATLKDVYADGGAKEVINTVQKTFNVPVDYYTMVNLNGMIKSVDKIGGVKVKSPMTFKSQGYKFKKGKTYQMSGEEATAFVMITKKDHSDATQQNRQMLVMKGLLKKTASYKAILNKSFLNSISDEANTNFTFNNLKTLATKYNKATKNVSTDRVEGSKNVSKSEKQHISNEIRSALGLKQAKIK